MCVNVLLEYSAVGVEFNGKHVRVFWTMEQQGGRRIARGNRGDHHHDHHKEADPFSKLTASSINRPWSWHAVWLYIRRRKDIFSNGWLLHLESGDKKCPWKVSSCTSQYHLVNRRKRRRMTTNIFLLRLISIIVRSVYFGQVQSACVTGAVNVDSLWYKPAFAPRWRRDPPSTVTVFIIQMTHTLFKI